MLLSMARGAAVTSASICGIPVFEYSPKTAKRAAVGMGTAAKEQVASVLASLCALEIKDIPDDMMDDAETYRAEMIEKICETDDELLEMFLEGEEPTTEQLKKALRNESFFVVKTFL